MQHAGTEEQCATYAQELNKVLASCGKKSATRPGKGLSCVPAQEGTGLFLLGAASTKDCKGLARTASKALKKIQRKPAVRFTCQTYSEANSNFVRLEVKTKRRCKDDVARINTLMGLFLRGDFQKCTAPIPEPPTTLSCLPHHTSGVADDVFQSSAATCPAHAQAINQILASCGLASEFSSGVTCSSEANRLRMLVADGDQVKVKAITRALNKALKMFDEKLPAAKVHVISGAVYSSKQKCPGVTDALNAMVLSNFVC